MALNAKQQQFVVEYIKDLNATQAAIRAGYSERTAYSHGQRLLKHVEIQGAIQQIQTERRNDAIMEFDEACAILSGIARGQVADYLDDDGRIDVTRVSEANPVAVQSIEQRTDVDKAGGVTRTTKFRLHSPIQAIQQLAKMRGWDAPVKQDVTVHQTLTDMLVAAGMDDVDDNAHAP